MNLHELRLGNLFDTINRRGPVHMPNQLQYMVTAITPHTVYGTLIPFRPVPEYKMVDSFPFPLRDIEPIPIDSFWRECFGFKHLEGHEKLVLSDYLTICYYNDDDKYYLLSGQLAETNQVVKLNHVHQLQNLGFALTNNELECNPAKLL